MEIVKIYKKGRKIRGYIEKRGNSFAFCTGKPSDRSCLTWTYSTIAEAEETAAEYIGMDFATICGY